MIFVEKVRAGRGAEQSLEDAVRRAVEECVSEGILAEFFTEHREEIVEMGIYEFDQEIHDKVLLEDGEAMAALKVPEADWVKYREQLDDN